MRNLIIDGNNLAYRARYSFDLSNNGEDVSITYGFLRVLFSMMSKFKPDTITVTWDYGIPEHRRKHMPEYKSNRKAKKIEDSDYEDMIRQMNLLHQKLPMFGIVSVRIPSCEADDIMYHASRIYKGHSIIVSTDEDMMQAITDEPPIVKVYHPSKEIMYGKKEFEDEYGIELDQLVYWKALQGDSSDNISGVRGIGPKIATTLFNKWGNLTKIINVALGIDPDKSMSESLAKKIVATGESKLNTNVYVIALFADRAGARNHIRRNISKWMPVSIPSVKRFLINNSFVSLVDKVGLLRKLERPEFCDNKRYPIVCNYRSPYGKNK